MVILVSPFISTMDFILREVYRSINVKLVKALTYGDSSDVKMLESILGKLNVRLEIISLEKGGDIWNDVARIIRGIKKNNNGNYILLLTPEDAKVDVAMILSFIILGKNANVVVYSDSLTRAELDMDSFKGVSLSKNEMSVIRAISQNLYTIDKIASATKISRATVYRSLKRLEEMRLIVKKDKKYEITPKGYFMLETCQ
ncbi:ArsR family transcriptional regulator [Sulfolobus tengchongensis]|uniref:ArsR family transcriptional regulator n=1 Tax=Sulfolobus tengchongensis TaxID=207809 RepID=A0AAX4L2G2_9CREN